MATVALITTEPVAQSAYGLELHREEDQTYRHGDLAVIPKPPERVLTQAFYRFQDEGLLPIIFYEGVPTLAWFLETYKELPVLAAVKVDRAAGEYHIRGLGWINTQAMPGDHRKGEVGMAFHRGGDSKETKILTSLMIEWAFKELKMDVLFGTTPVKNRATVRFMRHIGFDVHGPLPDYCTWQETPCGCWVSSLTQRQWRDMGVFSNGANSGPPGLREEVA